MANSSVKGVDSDSNYSRAVDWNNRVIYKDFNEKRAYAIAYAAGFEITDACFLFADHYKLDGRTWRPKSTTSDGVINEVGLMVVELGKVINKANSILRDLYDEDATEG